MKSFIRNTFRTAIATTLMVYSSVAALAVEIPLPENLTKDTDLIAFVHRVINLAIGLAGLIAVVLLVYNGIQYILSSGDEGKVDKATKGIIYAIVGLVICFLSVLIVNFIINNVITIA